MWLNNFKRGRRVLLKRVHWPYVVIRLCSLFLFSSLLYGTEKQSAVRLITDTNTTYIEIGKDRLSLSSAMKLVIFKNLTLRKAMYDLLQVDTELLLFQKKYDIQLGLEGKFSYRKVPAFNRFVLASQGNTTTEYDVIGSIRKMFSTGTELIGGIKNINFYDVNDTGFQSGNIFVPPNLGFYRPGFFLQVKQELLKNFLGQSDRATEESLKLRADITRSSLINQLASILVGTIGDYWKVTIAKKQLDTRFLELSSTKKIRQIIVRNSRLGISEKFDVNRYNSLVAVAEGKVARAKYQYKEAQRNLIRQVNLPAKTKITGVTDLLEKLPKKLDLQSSIQTALNKRVDFKNALLELKAIELEKKASSNNILPSLILDLKVQTASQSTKYVDGLTQAFTYASPSFDVKVKINYPLFGKQAYTDVRNAELNLRKQQIQITELKNELRDDVVSKHENVLLTFNVLKKSKLAEKESVKYYSGVFRRSKQGKLNAEAVKNALDSMINSRLQSLKDLVEYNIALLHYDLVKNEIFERYDLNVEQLLKKVKL